MSWSSQGPRGQDPGHPWGSSCCCESLPVTWRSRWGEGRQRELPGLLPPRDSLTSPPRACRVLIIPGVAVFYFETKRGLLMGIQLKPAANICFDAAAAAGQAGGGSRRRGPRCARQSRGWNARRGRALEPRQPERGPRRASPPPRRAGAGPAARAAPELPAGAQTQLCGAAGSEAL